jgi:hypothetical protein
VATKRPFEGCALQEFPCRRRTVHRSHSAAQPRTGRTVLDRRQPLMAIALDVALLGPRTNGRPLEAMILW